MLNHGLWQGFPDIDAITQLSNPDTAAQFYHAMVSRESLVPPGMYYTNCGMNYAFRREVAPFIYFPKLPDGMKRWDDIWMGIIFKRIADLFGWPVTSGWPLLRHERASDPLNNLRQEFLGYGVNEELWKVVDKTVIPGTDLLTREGPTPLRTYCYIAEWLSHDFPQLAETARLMRVWASLWETRP